ncbi:hypothetical protein ACFFRR_000119 [Megaselia abdita]
MLTEEFTLKINNKIYQIGVFNPEISLNTFIRQHAKLPGTKFMCREGGCGACVVTIKRRNPCSCEMEVLAANSCLTLLHTCKDYEITTIEGLGNWKTGYHPLQKNLAERNGSQCGYCSPGMVMSMNSLLESSNGKFTRNQVERNFGGNLCRCTGYRPILDAFKAFAQDSVDLEDIEELPSICPLSKEVCRLVSSNRSGSKWLFPTSIREVFDIFDLKAAPYRIVAGNTASGVYKKPGLEDFQTLVDVTRIPDLQAYEITNHLMIGGNVTLTNCIRIFEEASKTRHLEYLKKVSEHLLLVANNPVRDMGTIAGNLMTKHAHPDFASDIFTLLTAIDARVNIMANKDDVLSFTCENFLNFHMKECLIVSVTIPSYFAEEIYFESYKITPRMQNSHALVNAAFLLKISSKGLIESARIVFGNISSSFIRANATEKLLQSKPLPKDSQILQIITSLYKELEVEHNPPEPSPDYRRKLACGLFYKFLLLICPSNSFDIRYRSGSTKLYNERGDSSGSQDFPTNKSNYPLTQPVMKLEALAQCAGEAEYSNDIPPLPNEVFCAFVIATQVKRKIEKMDPSEALAIPGVLRFITKLDIPGKNSFISTKVAPMNLEEELFVNDVVQYNGQPCGVIVAENLEIAIRASEKVHIYYSSPSFPLLTRLFSSPKIRTFEDAISENTNSFKADKNSFTGILDIGGQYHFTMEPQTTVCIPKGKDMEVYCSTQWMNLVQEAISQILDVNQSSIQVKVLRVGGAYGSKVSRCSMIACACALVSFVMNRPARFIQTIESMMTSIGKRVAVHSEYQIQADSKGKITRLINNYLQDYGWSLNESNVLELAQEGMTSCYDGASWKVSGARVVTDAPKNTFARAPGTLEAQTMCETIMEHIAFNKGIDPISVRLENMPPDSFMKKMLPEFLKDISFYRRRSEIIAYNLSNKWLKKGISVSCMKYPCSPIPVGLLSTTVVIYVGDGTVAISHGGIEMGQGLNTKIAQVAASTLGVPLDHVKIMPSDTLNGGNSIITAKSVGSENVAFAVDKACKTLMKRLQPIKDKNKDAKWQAIVQRAYENNVSLTASEVFQPPDMTPYSVWGCSCTEVLLDVITGTFLIKRVDILEDVGACLSPNIDVGQVEGAFVMGLGYFLYEDLKYDMQTGKILTNNSWTYKIPGALDIPEDFRVKLVQSGPSGGAAGIAGSKGTGEPAVCLSISAPFALRYAIRAARKDLGLPDVFQNVGTPLSPEKVLLATSMDITKKYDTGK